MMSKIVLSSALLFAASAFAQQTPAPAAPPAAPAPMQIPNPHYVALPMSVDVNAPVDKVWARVGKYCDIGEWQNSPNGNTCKLLSGDGDYASIRSVGTELLVAKTQYSYTYTQAPRENTPYNLYHGTLEAVAVTPTTSRVTYTLFFDNSMLADDAARETDINNRKTRFTAWVQNIKILAEDGKMAPPVAAAAPAARPATTPAPYLSPNPHFVAIPLQIEVNAPVDKVWARVGKYCDIGEWGFPGCTILSGTEGEFGAVRSIANEVLVGKSKYSYTYTQPLRTSGFWPNYHGTMEARAHTPQTTTLHYTLVYDNSNLADDAAREADKTNRTTRFTHLLQNVKTVAEGGKLPAGALLAPPPSTPVAK